MPRLADQIGTVGKEQNPPEFCMLEQPVAEHASCVGFAGAGGHLDQCARMIGGERLEICDGVNLAFTQPLG